MQSARAAVARKMAEVGRAQCSEEQRITCSYLLGIRQHVKSLACGFILGNSVGRFLSNPLVIFVSFFRM
jgi:hypothetical protein